MSMNYLGDRLNPVAFIIWPRDPHPRSRLDKRKDKKMDQILIVSVCRVKMGLN
jgi:hypothetical protein